MKSVISVMAMIFVLNPFMVSGATINVPADEPTIQAGINAALAGDTVVVSDGTYTGTNNNNLRLYGKAITVMSENGSDFCVIDCEGSDVGFFLMDSETIATIIDGFTIQNGLRGMRLRNTSVTIKNCVVTAGTAGGVLIYDDAFPTLSFCNISGNTAATTGGGISIQSDSGLTLTDSTISGNRCAWYGGGVYCGSILPVTIERCTFSNNYASIYGGAIYLYGGNAAVIGGYPAGANRFENNIAGVGADLYSGGTDPDSINAQYNSFMGYFLSDYYVVGQIPLDLSNSTSDLSPITQDVYVSPLGDDSGNGLTPGTAFQTVQHALSQVFGTVSDPVTVHLAPGTYSPSATNETFPLPMVNYVTVSGSDMITTILDAELSSFGVMFYTDDSVELSGVTISGGQGENVGGIYSIGSSALISNCTLSNNTAIVTASWLYATGGGIFCSGGSPTITYCTFENNDGYFMGGGIGIVDSSPDISHCAFNGNDAGRGGGVGYRYCNTLSPITNSTFTGNSAGSGGAISVESSTPVIGGSNGLGNHFDNNTATFGADLCCEGVPSPQINARYNSFTGYHLSDFYVRVNAAFDLTGCTSELTPITQDVYISPSGDDDANDGLSAGTPFKTIHHALSRMYGDALNPVTIHLAAGTYSASATGEPFPLPLLNYVEFQGAGVSSSFLDAEDTTQIFNASYVEGVILSDIAFLNGYSLWNGGAFDLSRCTVTLENCDITGCYSRSGTGIYSYYSQVSCLNCNFSNNIAYLQGGGIYSSDSELDLIACSFTTNSADTGGGLYLEDAISASISDCIFTGNTASEFGAGLDCFRSDPTVTNCTITGNNATDAGGGINARDSAPVIIHSLIYSNTTDSGIGSGLNCTEGSMPTMLNSTVSDNTGGGVFISSDSSALFTDSVIYGNSGPDLLAPIGLDITYCNIGGGYTGTGNIDADPLFTTGTEGDFYLSHLDTGHGSDSPCIDTGSDQSANISFSMPYGDIYMSELTTRIDDEMDSDAVDIGYHYFPATYVTPTPTVTPTFTPAPTFTPRPIPSMSPAGTGTLILLLSVVMLIAIQTKK